MRKETQDSFVNSRRCSKCGKYIYMYHRVTMVKNETKKDVFVCLDCFKKMPQEEKGKYRMRIMI